MMKSFNFVCLLCLSTLQLAFAQKVQVSDLLDNKVFKIKTNYPNGTSIYLGIDETKIGVPGAKVGIWNPSSSKTQEWKFESTGPNTYKIKNLASADYPYMDANLSTNMKNGSVIHLLKQNDGKNQEWKVTKNATAYTIQTLEPTGGNRVLDLELDTTVGEIHLWAGNEGANQQWILEEIGPIEVMMSNGRGVIYVYPTDNSTSLIWGPYATKIGDLRAIPSRDDVNKDFKGAANTAAIVNQLKTNNDIYAAKLCADLVAYGFDDWYLPAAGELNEIYKKLGPNGSGQINMGYYWSSSERNAIDAWGQYFDYGVQYAFTKDENVGCRCVRR